AENGTVWKYDQNWYNCGDIIPDQVTPASDAITLAVSGNGVAGNSNEYFRGDHKHSLQVSDVLPAKDTATCEDGTQNTYARSDDSPPLNITSSIPHKILHSLNIDPTTENVPLVNATAAANGIAFQGNIADILITDAQPALPIGYGSIYQLFPNVQTGS
ncbi:MAG: hypothetical protein EZS28_026375, partial [Streblomastix strix]